MIPGLAGGVATAALGAAQLGYGLYQQSKNKRPTYQIPDEIRQNLNQAEHGATQGMSEATQQQYLSHLERGSAQALAASKTRGGGLAGIGQLNQNMNDGYLNLAVQNDQIKQANKDKLYGMRQNVADYKDQQFQINKQNPYYEGVAKNDAMMGSGIQNVSTGLQTGFGAMDSSKQMNQSNNAMQSSFWNKKIGQNYNQSSQNGFGDYNYQGGQYGNIG
ncbi:MAG: hypothetical protein V4721_10645 [Bacteroidota bacterium]